MRRRTPYFSEDLHKIVEDMLGINIQWGGYTPFEGFRRHASRPYVDLMNAGSEIIVTAELPGVNKADIRINATDAEVEITVESANSEGENRRCSRTRYDNFYVKETMPAEIDPKKIKATYKNGVLEIKAPKKESDKKKENKRRIKR